MYIHVIQLYRGKIIIVMFKIEPVNRNHETGPFEYPSYRRYPVTRLKP